MSVKMEPGVHRASNSNKNTAERTEGPSLGLNGVPPQVLRDAKEYILAMQGTPHSEAVTTAIFTPEEKENLPVRQYLDRQIKNFEILTQQHSLPENANPTGGKLGD